MRIISSQWYILFRNFIDSKNYMRGLLSTFIFGLICGLAGVIAGVSFGPQIRISEPARRITALAAHIPGLKSAAVVDNDSAYEMYDYPTIKWRAKPLADVPGAIAQLWTTYEWIDPQHQSGKMNYRLIVYKAPDKRQLEVQLLDSNGFKITQFEAADFHPIPGTQDIMEARDSHSCTEEQYKRAGDYSIK